MSNPYANQQEIRVTFSLWCIVSCFVLKASGNPGTTYQTQPATVDRLNLILAETFPKAA